MKKSGKPAGLGDERLLLWGEQKEGRVRAKEKHGKKLETRASVIIKQKCVS